jgi:hypothetical protein
MFEDGLSADLHDANIFTLTDAYRAGRNDLFIEIRTAVERAMEIAKEKP